MNPLGHYLPADRYCALARGESLPEYTAGAALFADISGFTPLTEALTRMLGPRRGVEELTAHLNRVYGALIGEVDRFGGSVIAFAGDAVTCWFDEDDGRRAIASGLAMQEAMGRLQRVVLPEGEAVNLAMKAAIAAGPARRIVVGHPDIQLMDVLAGRTLDRMGFGGHLAGRGQVVVDEETTRALGPHLKAAAWIDDPGGGGRVAHLSGVASATEPYPWPAVAAVDSAVIQPWLIPAVYRRLSGGEGEFLTELRPAVALFLKFGGLEFDEDPDAGRKLNEFVSWVQRSLHELEGFLIDVSTGDKGCYLYAAFGAPLAHEDDPWRALTAAHRLSVSSRKFGYITTVQIGLSRGTMRTGSYGGPSRRCYGILGDEVNMAARLMERASPGQVLVSESLEAPIRRHFSSTELEPFLPKGKRQIVRLFALGEPVGSASAGATIEDRSLPLVGRAEELASLEHRWSEVLQNRGQAVGLAAEAGAGKSRLVAEFLQRTESDLRELYVGQCLSHGTTSSYLGWWSIWRRFFGVEEGEDPEVRSRRLEEVLGAIDPSFALRLPLLGAALNLDLPDTEVTATFDAKLRKSSLEALLVDCVRHRAQERPLVLLLEDCHWVDPLSRDLAEAIARGTHHLPVLILATYRPPEQAGATTVFSPQLPHFTEIRLADLGPGDAEQFLRLKAAQLFGAKIKLPKVVVEHLSRRAQGNPYYLEQLLHYLLDRGVMPDSERVIESLELPATLHSLVLSRIDRLPEDQKTTLKVASVIGRDFSAHLVTTVHPHRDAARIRGDLREFERLELTLQDRPEPDLSYLFKQVVVQEVSYESMSFATRAGLHQQIGLFLERQHAHDLDRFADLLAHHFDRSPDENRRRIYLLKAGEIAQARYANAAAIGHYQRVLPLLPIEDRVGVQLKLGGVLDLVGRWQEAAEIYESALQQAEERDDRYACARIQTAMSDLGRKRGAYADASRWLAGARRLFRSLGDEAGLAETLQTAGTIAAQQGQYDESIRLYSASLKGWTRLRNDARAAGVLSNFAIVCLYLGDLDQARSLHSRALEIRRKVGERRAIANSLNNLGLVLREQKEYVEARAMIQESLTLYRELGDRWNDANSLASLAEVSLDQGDHRATHGFLTESLEVHRELGDRYALAFLLEIAAMLSAKLDQPRTAILLAAAAAPLRVDLGAALSPTEKAHLDNALANANASLTEEERRLASESATHDAPDQVMEKALAQLKSLPQIAP